MAYNNLYVYTDGSYFAGTYAGAFLAYNGTRCIHRASGCGTKASEMHNVAGELSAVMHAAKWLADNGHTGTIVYDYEGIGKWMTGEWKCKSPWTQMYYDYMKKYVDAGIVQFKWVRGHNGDLGNEQADHLARKALRFQKGWD